MNYRVYKIFRKDTGGVVYIGMTKQSIYDRLKGHFKEKRYSTEKYKYLTKYKDKIDISIIEDNINDKKIAYNKEIYYIKLYREIGYNLLNSTNGGPGFEKGHTTWNNGKRCEYVEKLMYNSPNKKMVYCYDLDGNYIREFNSIKKASEITKVSRSQIKNICDLKVRFKSGKGYTFRYFKSDKIEIKIKKI